MRRIIRHTRGISQIITTVSTATTINAATGCENASHRTVPTASSTPSEAAQLENGSGDVLMTARPPAFTKWLPAASVPPNIAAAIIVADDESPNTLAASAAPAGMRTNVCTRSHSESTPGILSAKNSTKHMKPDAASTYGCASTLSPPGKSTQPRKPAPPTMNNTAYKRNPLAHPIDAASAINCQVSNELSAFMTLAPLAPTAPTARRVCRETP